MTGKKTGQIPINSAILSIKSIGLCKRWQTQGAFRKRLIKDNRKKGVQKKMKCLWKKVICGALVAGMLAQCPQSIYAEDAANTATVTDTAAG